jgi:hypothetical protein
MQAAIHLINAYMRHPGALALVVTATMLGCAKSEPERLSVHPVSGQITLNGKPAAGATIVFHPQTKIDAPAPRANADKNGNFSVTTFNTADGAPAGEYVVTIDWRQTVHKDGDYVAGPSLVPAKYQQAKTSDLKVRVVAGQNQVPLKIVR